MLDKNAGNGAYQAGGHAGAVGESGGTGGAGFGGAFGGDGRGLAGEAGSNEARFGADGKAGSDWASQNPMKSADPADYFSRIGIDESIFKKVEKRYSSTTAAWKVQDLQAQMKPAANAPAQAKRAPASAGPANVSAKTLPQNLK